MCQTEVTKKQTESLFHNESPGRDIREGLFGKSCCESPPFSPLCPLEQGWEYHLVASQEGFQRDQLVSFMEVIYSQLREQAELVSDSYPGHLEHDRWGLAVLVARAGRKVVPALGLAHPLRVCQSKEYDMFLWARGGGTTGKTEPVWGLSSVQTSGAVRRGNITSGGRTGWGTTGAQGWEGERDGALEKHLTRESALTQAYRMEALSLHIDGTVPLAIFPPPS